MIEVKRVIAAADGTAFQDINSFTTENYIGIFTQHADKDVFAVFPRDGEFEMLLISCPDSLQALDDQLFDLLEEHIEKVSTSSNIEIKISENDA